MLVDYSIHRAKTPTPALCGEPLQVHVLDDTNTLEQGRHHSSWPESVDEYDRGRHNRRHEASGGACFNWNEPLGSIKAGGDRRHEEFVVFQIRRRASLLLDDGRSSSNSNSNSNNNNNNNSDNGRTRTVLKRRQDLRYLLYSSQRNLVEKDKIKEACVGRSSSTTATEETATGSHRLLLRVNSYAKPKRQSLQVSTGIASHHSRSNPSIHTSTFFEDSTSSTRSAVPASWRDLTPRHSFNCSMMRRSFVRTSSARAASRRTSMESLWLELMRNTPTLTSLLLASCRHKPSYA